LPVWPFGWASAFLSSLDVWGSPASTAKHCRQLVVRNWKSVE
jgi:hypothetical protein